jgi:polysaccharide biosynthesis protein PslG
MDPRQGATRFWHPFRWRRLSGLGISLVLLAGIPMTAPANAQTTGQSSDPRSFSQTGYRVDNDSFWSFFQQRGNVRTFGYPVSRTFMLDGFQVQIFQREVMQLQPDGSVQTLNLLDPGLMPYTQFNGSTVPAPDASLAAAAPPVSDPNYAADVLTFVRNQAPDTFNGQAVNFGTTFFSTVTAQDAPAADPSLLPGFDLQIWGVPTSQPAVDPTNHNFIYQRFQRGIMHYDQTCTCTQGLLLADYFKSILTGQNLPADVAQEAQGSKYYAQYAPGDTQWLARPNDLPGSDLTNAFIPEMPVGTPATPSFAYGFNVEMYNFSQDGKTMTAGLIKQAGFAWVAQQVRWDTIETAPGQFDWSQLDAIVSTASQNGLNIMFSVVHAPTFYRSATSGLTPADPAKYWSFTQALATRYAGKVQAYEIWNEENLSREMGDGNITPAVYVPLLEAGYAGVKAGDPNALVLLGAPSPTGANVAGQSIDDLTYLQQLYAFNGGLVKGYYDALSAHPSGFSNPPSCTPATPQCSLSGGFNNDDSFFAFTRVSEYRNVMTQQNESSKKIWFTEFGYCSNPTPAPGYEYCAYLTEQDQANFLVQAFQMARGLDYVAGMMQWNLNFQLVVPQSNEEWGFGVIRSDWSGRPAYSALLEMSKP